MKRTKLVAAEEKYRIALYQTLELLLPEAEKQARARKPALLRILTRATARALAAIPPDKSKSSRTWTEGDQAEINRQIDELCGRKFNKSEK